LSQIVVSGDAMLDVLRRRYLPFAITIPLAAEHADALARLLPWTDAMARRADQRVAYVCRNFTCEAPVTSPQELEAKL
jgi:uncharacterized protein YyaL (SSP411 family)